MFLIYSPHAKLHQACTDIQLPHGEMQCTISLNLTESAIHNIYEKSTLTALTVCKTAYFVRFTLPSCCLLLHVLFRTHAGMYLLIAKLPMNLKNKVFLKHY